MRIKTYLICLFVIISHLHSIEVPTSAAKLSKIQELINSKESNSKTYHSSPESDTLYSGVYLNQLDVDTVSQYFGYSFFTKRQEINIWDNLPPSADYILGPGDELIINIWGDTQLNSKHLIDKYGKIFIDKIGLVSINGLSIENAYEVLKKRLGRIYSTLLGDSPSSLLDVSLGDLKSLNVTFVGELYQPGLHKIHPFSTITTALFQVGGIKEAGTLRNIQIYRGKELFKSVDLYQLFSGQNFADDVQLKDGDKIYISPRYSTIELRGSFNNEGLFESRENETVYSLINRAGGLHSDASGKVGVNRRSLEDKSVYVDTSNWDVELIKNGDLLISIPEPSTSQNVAIYGQVQFPGEYPYTAELNVLDLLEMAGGIEDPAYRESMYLKKAQIVRRSHQNEYPELKIINLENVLENDPNHNFTLENLDVLIINLNPNYEPAKRVTITGEVQIPGVYTIAKRGESLQDILNRAEGFTSKAFEDGIQMYRDSGQVVLQDYNIVVMDGDSLHVPEHPGVVYVKGEVYNPGVIQYRKGKGLGHYIESAGGYNYLADSGRIVVFYANGDVKIKKWYSNPKIKEGATIIVYPKEIREPINWTEFAKNISSIIASFATVIVLLNN